MKLTSLKSVAGAIFLAVAALASNYATAENIPVKVTVSGSDFQVQVDEPALLRYHRPQTGTGYRTIPGNAPAPTSAEIAKAVNGKLAELFPNGVPPPIASRIKIECWARLRPLSVGCTATF